MKRPITLLMLSIHLFSSTALNPMDFLLQFVISRIPAHETSSQENPTQALLEKIKNPTSHRFNQFDELTSLVTQQENKEQAVNDLFIARKIVKEQKSNLELLEIATRTGNFKLRKALGYACGAGSIIAGSIPLNMARKIVVGVLPLDSDNLTGFTIWTAISAGMFLYARQQYLSDHRNQEIKTELKLYNDLLAKLVAQQNVLFTAHADLQNRFPQQFNKLRLLYSDKKDN